MQVRGMTIAESAAALGVSVDTVRRRIKQGLLEAHTELGGRLVVVTPVAGGATAVAPAVDQDHLPFTRPMRTFIQTSTSDEMLDAEREQLTRDLEHTRALLAEVQRQRDDLSALLTAQRSQVETLTRLLEQDATERTELRRLLSEALQAADRRASGSS